MLAVWPRSRSFEMMCRSGVDGALKHVEKSARLKGKAAREEALANLGKLLWFCREFPSAVWCVAADKRVAKSAAVAASSGQRAHRLLKLSVELQAKDEGVQLIDLLAAEFPIDAAYLKSPRDARLYCEGVRSRQVALAVAELVSSTTGWTPEAREALARLVVATGRMRFPLSQQIQMLAVLSSDLLDRQVFDAAQSVGQFTHKLVEDVADVNLLDDVTLCSYVAMAVHLEDDQRTSNRDAIARLSLRLVDSLDVGHLGQLIVHLQRSCAVNLSNIAPCRDLFTALCRCDVDSVDAAVDRTPQAARVDVMRCLVWLQDQPLVERLADQMMSRAAASQDLRRWPALDGVATCPEIVKLATASDAGRVVVNKLIEARVAELVLRKQAGIHVGAAGRQVRRRRRSGTVTALQPVENDVRPIRQRRRGAQVRRRLFPPAERFRQRIQRRCHGRR